VALDLDITYLLVVVLFSAPLLVVNYLIFRPFEGLFERRHDRLEGALARASDKLDSLARQGAEFEQKMRDAAKQGATERTALRKEVSEMVQKEVNASKERTKAQLEKSLRELSDSRASAMESLEHNIEDLARTLSAQLLGRKVS
jgi:F0F1-type ATP synthase membrane subunit b/b'